MIESQRPRANKLHQPSKEDVLANAYTKTYNVIYRECLMGQCTWMGQEM